MAIFTSYNPDQHQLADLVSAIIGAQSGVQIVPSSIQLVYGIGVSEWDDEQRASLSFYDGSLTELGIGAGLLLTSGDSSPPTQNTSGGYSVELEPSHTDAQLQTTVHQAFSGAGTVQDATVLEFQFAVAPGSTGVQFDLVFGSDEYPEWVDSNYVDIAAVYVNDVNYALFNNNPNQPLSILNTNLAAGNFRDNSGHTHPALLPIEYDGVSSKLTIVAPVQEGSNHIRIAVSDTGDQVLDSGLFISNMRAVGYTGAGLALEVIGSDGKDILYGQDFNEVFNLGTGNDLVFLALGDDVIVGSKNSLQGVVLGGELEQFQLSKEGSSWVLQGPAGIKTLADVELVYFDKSGLFAIADEQGNMPWWALALATVQAGQMPDPSLISQWMAGLALASGDAAAYVSTLLEQTPGLTPVGLVQYLGQAVYGWQLEEQQASQIIEDYVGPGKTFEDLSHLVFYVAQTPENISKFAPLVGQPVALPVDPFLPIFL